MSPSWQQLHRAGQNSRTPSIIHAKVTTNWITRALMYASTNNHNFHSQIKSKQLQFQTPLTDNNWVQWVLDVPYLNHLTVNEDESDEEILPGFPTPWFVARIKNLLNSCGVLTTNRCDVEKFPAGQFPGRPQTIAGGISYFTFLYLQAYTGNWKWDDISRIIYIPSQQTVSLWIPLAFYSLLYPHSADMPVFRLYDLKAFLRRPWWH